MPAYRVVALPTSIASEARATGRSPGYGHPTHIEVAKGYGPCRHCLRFFDVGAERRVLLTYDAFHGTDPRPLPGPVFIHESDCERYAEDAGFPYPIATHRLTIVAYGDGRVVRAEEHVVDGAVDPVIDRLLARDDVAYLHVRDTDAGCFDFAILPASA